MNKQQKLTVFPIAKINLGLNIVGERPDGYHNLETVFYPITDVQDELSVETITNGKPGTIELEINGNSIDCTPEKNLVAKAYRLLENEISTSQKSDFSESRVSEFPDSQISGLPALRFSLTKNIPMQAGMGGGSSDGAFALKAINQYCGLNLNEEQLEALALKLGADAPFFIRHQPCFATGVGEIMTPIPLDISAYQIRFFKHPSIAVSTADAFRGIPVKKPARSCREIVLNEPIERWKDMLVNDFEQTVFAKYPELAEIKQQMYNDGAIYAAMTGSGSVIYGIFKSTI